MVSADAAVLPGIPLLSRYRPLTSPTVYNSWEYRKTNAADPETSSPLYKITMKAIFVGNIRWQNFLLPACCAVKENAKLDCFFPFLSKYYKIFLLGKQSKKKVHIFGLCPKYWLALPSHANLGLKQLGRFCKLKTPRFPSEIGTFKFEK